MRSNRMLYRIGVLLIVLWIWAPNMNGQGNCIDNLEEQYLLENYHKVLDIAQTCPWEDSSRILPWVAYSAFNKNDYPFAKEMFHRSLERGDTQAIVLQTLARIYEEEWNFPKAIKYNKLLLQSDSNNTAEWYRLGLIASKADLLPEAIMAFTKTLSLNPMHFQARVKVADILIHQKESKHAYALLQRGLQLDSQNVLLLLYSGKAAYFRDSFHMSIKYYEKAEQSIDLPLAHTRMKAISHYQMDEFQKAIKYLSNALVGTDKDYMHYYMAMSYLGLGENEEAAQHFDSALEESYGSRIPLYCDYRAGIYENEGNWESAINLYKEAYDRSNEPKFLIRIANAYDNWYEDKRLTIRYLNDYLNTGDISYRSFAEDRLNILRAYEHMKNITDEAKTN